MKIILKTYVKHWAFDSSGPLSVEFPAVENTKQTKVTFSEAITDQTYCNFFIKKNKKSLEPCTAL